MPKVKRRRPGLRTGKAAAEELATEQAAAADAKRLREAAELKEREAAEIAAQIAARKAAAAEALRVEEARQAAIDAAEGETRRCTEALARSRAALQALSYSQSVQFGGALDATLQLLFGGAGAAAAAAAAPVHTVFSVGVQCGSSALSAAMETDTGAGSLDLWSDTATPYTILCFKTRTVAELLGHSKATQHYAPPDEVAGDFSVCYCDSQCKLVRRVLPSPRNRASPAPHVSNACTQISTEVHPFPATTEPRSWVEIAEGVYTLRSERFSSPDGPSLKLTLPADAAGGVRREAIQIYDECSLCSGICTCLCTDHLVLASACEMATPILLFDRQLLLVERAAVCESLGAHHYGGPQPPYDDDDALTQHALALAGLRQHCALLGAVVNQFAAGPTARAIAEDGDVLSRDVQAELLKVVSAVEEVSPLFAFLETASRSPNRCSTVVAGGPPDDHLERLSDRDLLKQASRAKALCRSSVASVTKLINPRASFPFAQANAETLRLASYLKRLREFSRRLKICASAPPKVEEGHEQDVTKAFYDFKFTNAEPGDRLEVVLDNWQIMKASYEIMYQYFGNNQVRVFKRAEVAGVRRACIEYLRAQGHSDPEALCDEKPMKGLTKAVDFTVESEGLGLVTQKAVGEWRLLSYSLQLTSAIAELRAHDGERLSSVDLERQLTECGKVAQKAANDKGNTARDPDAVSSDGSSSGSDDGGGGAGIEITDDYSEFQFALDPFTQNVFRVRKNQLLRGSEVVSTHERNNYFGLPGWCGDFNGSLQEMFKVYTERWFKDFISEENRLRVTGDLAVSQRFLTDTIRSKQQLRACNEDLSKLDAAMAEIAQALESAKSANGAVLSGSELERAWKSCKDAGSTKPWSAAALKKAITDAAAAKDIHCSPSDVRTKTSALSFAAKHSLLPPPANPAMKRRAERATAKVDKAQTVADTVRESLVKAEALQAELEVVRDRYSKMECGLGFFHQLGNTVKGIVDEARRVYLDNVARSEHVKGQKGDDLPANAEKDAKSGRVKFMLNCGAPVETRNLTLATVNAYFREQALDFLESIAFDVSSVEPPCPLAFSEFMDQRAKARGHMRLMHEVCDCFLVDHEMQLYAVRTNQAEMGTAALINHLPVKFVHAPLYARVEAAHIQRLANMSFCELAWELTEVRGVMTRYDRFEAVDLFMEQCNAQCEERFRNWTPTIRPDFVAYTMDMRAVFAAQLQECYIEQRRREEIERGVEAAARLNTRLFCLKYGISDIASNLEPWSNGLGTETYSTPAELVQARCPVTGRLVNPNREDFKRYGEGLMLNELERLRFFLPDAELPMSLYRAMPREPFYADEAAEARIRAQADAVLTNTARLNAAYTHEQLCDSVERYDVWIVAENRTRTANYAEQLATSAAAAAALPPPATGGEEEEGGEEDSLSEGEEEGPVLAVFAHLNPATSKPGALKMVSDFRKRFAVQSEKLELAVYDRSVEMTVARAATVRSTAARRVAANESAATPAFLARLNEFVSAPPPPPGLEINAALSNMSRLMKQAGEARPEQLSGAAFRAKSREVFGTSRNVGSEVFAWGAGAVGGGEGTSYSSVESEAALFDEFDALEAVQRGGSGASASVPTKDAPRGLTEGAGHERMAARLRGDLRGVIRVPPRPAAPAPPAAAPPLPPAAPQ